MVGYSSPALLTIRARGGFRAVVSVYFLPASGQLLPVELNR
jgi:hypothetical protein